MRNILFVLLVIGMMSCKQPKDQVIAIQTIGSFKTSLLDSVKSTIAEVYGFKVITLPNMELPQSAFIHLKSPRYRADSLIRILKRLQPDSVDFTLGLVQNDISTTKRNAEGAILKPVYKYNDWGVFGLGYRPGPSCIVSTFRIKAANKNKLVDRLKKVCVHELGHNLGLKHCEYDAKCVMRDAAESIKTVDQVHLILCEHCKSEIE